MQLQLARIRTHFFLQLQFCSFSELVCISFAEWSLRWPLSLSHLEISERRKGVVLIRGCSQKVVSVVLVVSSKHWNFLVFVAKERGCLQSSSYGSRGFQCEECANHPPHKQPLPALQKLHMAGA